MMPPTTGKQNEVTLLADLAPPCDDPNCAHDAQWILWARSPRPCGCIPTPGEERVCTLCDACLSYWTPRRFRCPACLEKVGTLLNLIGRQERI